jgi:hypothetical protein
MTTSTDRFALYEMMKAAWGEQLATALIGAIPPMAPTDIATKQDIENLAVQLRGEMSELCGEMAALRGELIGEFRASTRHTIVTIVAAAVSIWLSFYLPNVI